ncbi:thiolase [Achromobacter xylosoxidans]|uniref:Thiolase n=1 Tax=Alcaligenes xylosoxydans xylosoxydans TaxID=85698 RepID=A0A424WB44_ALCXX|nr:thiolase [Achromobacter xylosoxidans]MBC9906355.1 thiolase [Achromobacter xylosoxidans]MBD0870445.1 thiolase [Achromobacter xylosoxidans]QNP83994.1 thiolase [Achromobacter xylosoxidans]RPJ90457.1 thiolase [Achromobacter xylosoxidans]
MTLRDLRGKTAVVGVGQAGLGQARGHTEQEVLAQAAMAAIADAGLSLKDIDGITTCSSLSPMWAMSVVEYLGIRPTFLDSTMIGGSSYVAHLLPAMHALASGQCNAVLVCYGSTQRTAKFNRADLTRARKSLDPQPYETPYDPPLPVAAYALAASRHMHQYGTTRKQLSEVAVAARKWAQLNPEATMREPLSLADVEAARPVCAPFTVRDCCMVSDGAGAFVLTRSDRARDCARKPVYVMGNATAVWNRQVSSMHDLTVTAAFESGKRCYEMAGVSAKDMDLAMLYDAFTINTILFLEDLGFCQKGEGGAFVDDGGIAPGGRLAVNTNGGGLSCVHPGMYGVFLMVEAVRQLRGECGERQLKDPNLALVHGNGGTLSSQSTAILSALPAL